MREGREGEGKGREICCARASHSSCTRSDGRDRQTDRHTETQTDRHTEEQEREEREEEKIKISSETKRVSFAFVSISVISYNHSSGAEP